MTLSVQVEVEPAVPTSDTSDFRGHTLSVRAREILTRSYLVPGMDFHGQIIARGARLLLGRPMNMYIVLTQMDQTFVPDFGRSSSKKKKMRRDGSDT